MSKQIINSVFIENVGVNATPSSLVKLFAELQVATVKQVTIFPEYNAKQKKLNYGAYIEVDWLDTEIAYNFLKCIKNPMKEARVFYTDTNYWVVKKNPSPAFAPSKWTVAFENPANKIFKQLEEEDQTILMHELEEGKLEQMQV